MRLFCPAKAVQYIPKEVEIVEGDLCDADSVEKFFGIPKGKQSIVIHCTSMVIVNPDFNQKLIDVNVGGTKNIIDACITHPECEKLVYVSSTDAIPETPKGTKIKEADSFDPDKVVGWYSHTKAMVSQLVLDAVKVFDLNACIVHHSGILGPNDCSLSETTRTIIKIINGEMPVGMQGSFNLCDVRDLAYGCIMAADKGRKGECYILVNEQVTLKEMNRMIQKETGSKSIKFYLQLVLARVLARSMEKKAKKTGKPPVMTTFSVYNLERNNEFDYLKAKNELGYKTRSYEETMRDEATWLISSGKVSLTK